MTTPFRTDAEAALTSAGFEPITLDDHPYRNVRSSPSDAGYRRPIEGTGNELVVVVRDDYAFACAINPEITGVFSTIAKSEPVYTVDGILPKARWAWRVGREEDHPCQLLTQQSGYKQVCNSHFIEKPGGYICSSKCWLPRRRPSRRTTAGYF